MEAVFLKLVNLSISAGWLVLAILVLRLIFQAAPKWIFCLLWGLVALRLVCPVSLESALSLIPSAQTLPPDILYMDTPQIDSGIQAINSAVNPVLGQSMAPAPGASANPVQIWSFVLLCIWLAGAAVMAGYALLSCWLLKRRVATATLLQGNIRQSEYVDAPFVLGIFRPIIYLPYGLEERDRAYVIAHERAHILRKDHWWKPLGFALLCVYWFNPLLWVAYILLCRDIEGACDEKVIREMELEDRRGYSTALLHCGVRPRAITACPLAFGEVGVKARVTSVMNYKKPAFWIVAAALAACAAAMVCFLTDPPAGREFPMEGNHVSDLAPQKIVEHIAKVEKLENSAQLCVNQDNFELQVTADFQWANSPAVRYFYTRDQQTYSAQLRIFADEKKYFVTEAAPWPEQERIFNLQTYLEAVKYLPREKVRELLPEAAGYVIQMVEEGTPGEAGRSVTYTDQGVNAIDGWLIHLRVDPMYEGDEGISADESVHLFYGGENAAPTVTKWFDYTATPWDMDWDGELVLELPQFPEVTFFYTPERITTQGWKFLGREYTLVTGMPIWNAYFCDLTGDGLPELCATYSWGSGMVDTRVAVYDCAAGGRYNIEGRGERDYALRYNQEDGLLYVDVRPYGQDRVTASGPLVFRDGCLQILDSSLEWQDGAQITHLPGDYDLDRDGNPETVELATYFDDSLRYEARVLRADGKLLWQDTAYTVHSGYNSVFVCRLEDGDYLLRYHPTMYQGYATYAYELFYLDGEGNPVSAGENSVSFDLNQDPAMHESFDPVAIADFMEALNGLLANSKLLMTTHTALRGIDPDHPQDNLWWLQEDEGYDESLSLRENLMKFSEYY